MAVCSRLDRSRDTPVWQNQSLQFHRGLGEKKTPPYFDQRFCPSAYHLPTFYLIPPGAFPSRRTCALAHLPSTSRNSLIAKRPYEEKQPVLCDVVHGIDASAWQPSTCRIAEDGHHWPIFHHGVVGRNGAGDRPAGHALAEAARSLGLSHHKYHGTLCRQRPGEQQTATATATRKRRCGRPTVVLTRVSLSLQYESVLIQKLFTHFKKTPGTHKLGVLYVVDSVTRKWLDQAKAQGQTPSLSAPDGTFAAGVHRVTELIPILMNDILATAPEDQKVRREHCIAFPGTYPATLVPGTTHGNDGSQGHARGIHSPWNCSSLSVSRSCFDLRTRTLFSLLPRMNTHTHGCS